MFDHGTPEWHAAQRAERMREHTAAMQRHKDAAREFAVRALCDIGIQAMQKQSPAMMANVDYEGLMAVMTAYILARQ